MSKDVYRPCPCGSGKKIKFCCKESAADIEKISRLIEADQRKAALELVERLLVKKPGLHCLHAFKLQLTIGEHDYIAMMKTIDDFLKIAPANPAALAAQAIRYAADWDARKADQEPDPETWRFAVDSMQRAVSNLGQYVSMLVASAATYVATRLQIEGKDLAAYAHHRLRSQFAPGIERSQKNIVDFLGEPEISLIAKDHYALPSPPPGAAWSDEYEAARLKASKGAWADAASAIEGLARVTLGEPVPRRAVGLLRACLGDNEKAVTLLRASNSMDNVSEEDAIRFEALAQFLDESQHSRYEALEVRCQVDDANDVLEKLLAAPNIIPSDVDPKSLHDDDGAHPMNEFMLVDRPPPSDANDFTVANTPRALAVVHIFDRRIEGDAKLEYVVEAIRHDEVKKALAGIVGESIIETGEVVHSEVSVSEKRLVYEELVFPPGTPRSFCKRIESEANRAALREVWPDEPDLALDGKTPREAARDPDYAVRLKAAIRVLEAMQWDGLDREAFEQLREAFGLERTPDIVCRPGEIEILPLVDLVRVDPSRLSDGDLVIGFYRASMVVFHDAARRFAEEIVGRPDSERLDKLPAHLVLASLPSANDSSVNHMSEAQRIVKERGESPARLMLQEMMLRATQGRSERFRELHDMVVKRHIHEPGIREGFIDVMVRLGILDPDEARPQDEPVSVSETAEGASQIWTPDQESGGAEGEKSELWVPD